MGDFIYKLPLMKLPTTSYSILIIHHYLIKKQYTNEYKTNQITHFFLAGNLLGLICKSMKKFPVEDVEIALEVD